jgi:hypothetical protein
VLDPHNLHDAAFGEYLENDAVVAASGGVVTGQVIANGLPTRVGSCASGPMQNSRQAAAAFVDSRVMPRCALAMTITCHR